MANFCCYNRTCAIIMAVIISLILLHNLTKVPYYLPIRGTPAATNATWDGERCGTGGGAEQWCFGMEATINLAHWTGYRGVKMYSSPNAYLAPHTMMGCVLLSAWAMILCKQMTLKSAAPYFVPVSVLFAIHTLPYAGMTHMNGMPDRIVGALHPPVNRPALVNPSLLVAIFIGNAIVCVGLYLQKTKPVIGYRVLVLGYLLICSSVIAAPTLEIPGIFLKAFAGQWSDSSREGNMPLWWSGNDPLFHLADSPAFGNVSCTLILLSFGFFMFKHNQKQDADTESAVIAMIPK